MRDPAESLASKVGSQFPEKPYSLERRDSRCHCPSGGEVKRSKLFALAPKVKSVLGSFGSHGFLPIVIHRKIRFISFAAYMVLRVDQPAVINRTLTPKRL